MNWFQGEVSEAIQKAIGEKKIFIVFVRGTIHLSIFLINNPGYLARNKSIIFFLS